MSRVMRDGVAVVTGAASGIGAGLALVLARRGMRVICADVDGAGAEATARAIRGFGREASHARTDVTSADEVEALAAQAAAAGGRGIALWVNNAGIAVGGPAEALTLADWRRVLEVNLMGVVHGIHAIYPRMIAAGRGHILNIASVSGLAPYPLVLPYVTSKHAVVGLSQALRAEARDHGVAVSVACPGVVDTAIWTRSEVRGALAASRDRLLARMSRMPVERCAEAIVRGVEANRAVIPVTLEAQIAWRLARISPALVGWLSSRLARGALDLAQSPPTKRP